MDEIAAEHASCDAAIHFGPSCLSPASRLPVALVFPSCRNFNVQHFIATVQPVISSGHNSKEVILLYDTAFFPVLGMPNYHIYPICYKYNEFEKWNCITVQLLTELIKFNFFNFLKIFKIFQNFKILKLKTLFEI